MDLRLALLYSHSRNRLLVKSIFVVFCAFVAYQCSIAVITDDFTNITILGLAAFVIASAIAILNDWRRGSIVFLVCLLFEDIVRKYSGNNMVIAFGKDVVLLVVYLAFFVDQRRLRTRTFRPP